MTTHVNGKKHTSYYLSVSNTDTALMRTCALYLDLLLIGHTEWEFRTRSTCKPIGTLHICRAEDIKRFAFYVGFAAPHKADTLERIIKWIDRPAKWDDRLAEIGKRYNSGEPLRSICTSLGLKPGAHALMAVRLRAAGYEIAPRGKGRKHALSPQQSSS